jgi:hypothetical protein
VLKRLLLALWPVQRVREAGRLATELHVAVAADLGLPLERIEVRVYALRGGHRVEVTARGWAFGTAGSAAASEAAARRVARRVWADYGPGGGVSAVLVTLTDASAVRGGARVRTDEFTFFSLDADRADGPARAEPAA